MDTVVRDGAGGVPGSGESGRPAVRVAGRRVRYSGRFSVDAIPVRHPGQWVLAVVILLIAVFLAIEVYKNPNLDHPTFVQFLASPAVLEGLLVTVELTIIASVAAIAIGVVLAVMQLSKNPVLKAASWLYVWAFRATPLLVLLLVLGNFGLFFKYLGIGVPFTDIWLFRFETNDVLTGFVASILALALHEGAYMAEIIRGGILAIEGGQGEAARALGMPGRLVMRRIVLPQAMRVIIPPVGNQVIGLMKASSLVSVIAGGDLLTVTQNIYAQNYRVMELLFVATFWYFVLVTITSIGQHFIERNLARKQVL